MATVLALVESNIFTYENEHPDELIFGNHEPQPSLKVNLIMWAEMKAW